MIIISNNQTNKVTILTHRPVENDIVVCISGVNFKCYISYQKLK